MAAVELNIDGDVAELVLNRPDKKNSLRDEDFLELQRRLDDLAASAARAALFRGAGGAFSAGRDIAGVNPETDDSERVLKQVINPVFLKIRALPFPTIAAVEGPCLGGGFGIAFACDIVLAAENAVLGSPFRNIGCILDSGGHHVLKDRLGPHRAAELIYTGRLISGREAAEIGLVNRAVEATELLEEARRMAALIAAGPTAAFRISKQILQADLSFEQVLDREAEGQARAIRTEDGIEGFRAFQEKRRPTFRGR